MDNISNEERSAEKDGARTSSDVLQISSADTAAPAKKAASMNEHTHVECDTSAAQHLSDWKKEPLVQTKTTEFGKEKAYKAAQDVTVLHHNFLSDKARRLCRVADQILGCMAEVEETMEQFQRYIQTQKEASQPLYKWAKYTGYRAISRAITDLDQASSKFEAVHLPSSYVNMYLSRATRLSLSVSKIAVFAMGVMNEKSSSCIDEVEESDLSAEGKANAQCLITGELKRLLKHCARATDRVYTSLDLLRNALLTDQTHQAPALSSAEAVNSHGQGHTIKGWLRSIAGLTFGAAASAAIGLAAAHFYTAGGSFDLAQLANNGGLNLNSQVLDIVQRTQTVTNLTGEIYSIKLQDLDKRYNQLKDYSDSHGLRIDNLVEALGSPNEQGTYYTSTSSPKQHDQVPVDVQSYTRKVADDANRQIARLHTELEQMRKNINRMDIRLMKRLDKVDRYRS